MGAEAHLWELGMEFIIGAAAFVFFIAIAFTSLVAIYIGGETVLDDPNDKMGWGIFSGGVIGLILCIALVSYGFSKVENNSEHCGPGTEYRESRHYNPSTRSTHIDWWCEVK